MKNLIILGSTGSIGTQCLDVVRTHPSEFVIDALATHRNVELLAKQVNEFKPKWVGVVDEKAAEKFDKHVLPAKAIFVKGPDAMTAIARQAEGEVAVIATVGAAGFKPTFEAVNAGKHIALANKEVLAMAGDLLMNRARKKNVPVLPIDSEHSAIQQCLHCGGHDEILKIILTASGGPFRGKKPDEFENVSVKEALKHPTWTMGAKITIDSATMFNKGLEVIEAHHLFNLPLNQIDVIIHPQSIIHSMVEYNDGSIMAQLGDADMRTPIQYALSFPRRIERSGRKLDLLDYPELTFFKPDMNSFPCLRLAYDAAHEGGTMPAYLSVANEEIVQAFLDEKITFGSIPRLLEKSMNKHNTISNYSLTDIYQINKEARVKTQELISQQ